MIKQKKEKKDINRLKIGHRPRKWTDLELFQKRIEEFFADCDSKGRPYTTMGLAMAVNLSRENLIKYEDERPGYSEAIRRARDRIQRDVEESLIIGGKLGKNIVGLIFWLKNNANWADELRLAGVGGEPLALEMSSLEVAARVITILELARVKREERDVETVQKALLPEKISD
ncbi:MAG: terminase small subunit [Thermodesulfobacteriota bacterium]|jgi:hypothetical protein